MGTTIQLSTDLIVYLVVAQVTLYTMTRTLVKKEVKGLLNKISFTKLLRRCI